MKTGPNVLAMRSAREVQTPSSGRIIGGTVLGHCPQSSHHPESGGAQPPDCLVAVRRGPGHHLKIPV